MTSSTSDRSDHLVEVPQVLLARHHGAAVHRVRQMGDAPAEHLPGGLESTADDLAEGADLAGRVDRSRCGGLEPLPDGIAVVLGLGEPPCVATQGGLVEERVGRLGGGPEEALAPAGQAREAARRRPRGHVGCLPLPALSSRWVVAGLRRTASMSWNCAGVSPCRRSSAEASCPARCTNRASGPNTAAAASTRESGVTPPFWTTPLLPQQTPRRGAAVEHVVPAVDAEQPAVREPTDGCSRWRTERRCGPRARRPR